MSRYWSPVVHRLSPYVPGEQPKIKNLIKLNTNENPYGPSPRALAAISAEVNDGLRLYPDPTSMQLRQALAGYHGLDTAQVFVGNGSDEVLAHIFHGLLQQSAPLLFPDITYSFYPVYCGLYGIDYATVPLGEQFELRVADYVRPNGGIIFPNPNAPTGRLLALADIDWLLARNTDSVVVVDEAYVDFGGDSAVALVNRYPNLLVTQTLSKSRSLAGLRVGFALGHADLIQALERVKDSFNSYPLDRLAIAGATAAIEDREHFERTRQAVIAGREELVRGLLELGFTLPPSAANFVFATHPRHDAAELAAQLRARGIIVRHFRLPRIEQHLRITIGRPEENAALLEALRQIV
ncbi:MAG: histidinol-phosphate transaminase [Gammaproteobacteria bacterium HGW-Gammaproteobacteria-1]|jgi:histidinol-phosphate aminotransferase|nr:MAG: histidinol-phosphate transaminase [Gammaproteobacteria bacterium HGW-Gammaproteobacteria-1]